jgi:hypothetical protein
MNKWRRNRRNETRLKSLATERNRVDKPAHRTIRMSTMQGPSGATISGLISID